MKLEDQHVEAVVAAVLAVNSYPLVKAWDLVPDLRKAGLTTPDSVAREDLGRLTDRLAAAGYDRGGMTWIVAERVQFLMQAVQEGKLDSLAAAVSKRDKSAATTIMCQVKGIGPTVAQSAWILLETR